ncbi:serum opacification factor [Streptococcus porcinus]|uniref:serum opacification factor n=1 Tax=Streptococcus porcinus TaxID=1340 RepID=UPI0019612157|nr:serum opacification factor [Streptococcus porcinus]
MKMINRKYKLRKLSIGLVSVGTMFMTTAVAAQENVNSNNTTDSAQLTASNTSETPSNSSNNDSTEVSNTENNVTSSSLETTEKAKENLDEPQALTSTQSNSNNTVASNTESSEMASPQGATNDVERVDVTSETIEVDNYSVDNEKSSLTVTDGQGTDKLIKNRDGKNREIFDIHREVVNNQDGTLDVKLTVAPKEIDKGAEVIVLLDTSQKMKEDDFKTAKENITKLVNTLTDKTHPHNARNSIRLINFYRKVNDPIELTKENVDNTLDQVWKKAKEDYDWGVDLQGAIHKAREIFNKEKQSGKRQHIVLFSQGEATFSYDFKNKETVAKQGISDKTISHTSPLLPWPFYIDASLKKRNIIEDATSILKFLDKVGLSSLKDKYLSQLNLAKTANGIGSIFGNYVGIDNPLDYILLKELTPKESVTEFDYDKKVGEGYHYLTHSHRELAGGDIIDKFITNVNLELKDKMWFGGNTTQYLAKLGVEKALKNIFYRRNHIFYNHNLSAQAEARKAQEEGIVFYSFALTKAQSKANDNVLSFLGPRLNDNKFDLYLKQMSENKKFLKDSDVSDDKMFKDTLTSLDIKDEFENSTSLINNSWKTSLDNIDSKEKKNHQVSHKASSNTWLSGTTKESLTWTLSQEDLQKAFETGTPLTLTYKLKIDKEKFKGNIQKKRDLSLPNSKEAHSEKVISNTISYNINDKKVNKQKLDDVTLTYSKEKLVKKIVNETKHEILKFKTQEFLDNTLPKGQQVLVTKGENGSITSEFQNTYLGDKLIDSKLLLKITKNPRHQVIKVGTKVETPASEGLDNHSVPIVITDNTKLDTTDQPNHTTTTEDLATERDDLVVGSQSDFLDSIEDTQVGMSGTIEETVIEEDTYPNLDLHFDNEAPNSEAELPQVPTGEEDNNEYSQISMLEDDKEVSHLLQITDKTTNQTSPAPIAQTDNQLPQTGDKENSCEAFFTMTALAIIGAAGLLNKKRHDKHID